MLWFLLSVCLYKPFSSEAVTAVNRMVQYLGIIHSEKNSLNLHPGNSKRLSISGEGRNETKLSSSTEEPSHQAGCYKAILACLPSY